MERILEIVSGLLLAILSVFSGGNRMLSEDSVYARTMIVSEVNYEQDIVCLTDAVGFKWSFAGAEDWCVGDYASCVMYDSGTKDTILDDEIVSVTYAGTSEDYVLRCLENKN